MTLMWRKQLEIGDETIDTDHKYLVCLINTVELTMRTLEHRDLLPATLEQLFEYTHAHFKREESIMLSMNYPRYYQHKQQHQLLIQELADIQQKVQQKIQEYKRNQPSQLLIQDPAATQPPVIPEKVEGVAAPDEKDTDIKAAAPGATERVFSDEDCAALAQLFRHWLLDHLVKEDMRLRPFLTGKQD